MRAAAVAAAGAVVAAAVQCQELLELPQVASVPLLAMPSMLVLMLGPPALLPLALLWLAQELLMQESLMLLVLLVLARVM